jgi:folate-binding protein YgfZ
MGRPDDDQAIHEGAAIGAISARLQIAVAGRDRASFLQGLLTNDIQALTPGSGCYAAWLTPQGRMLTDMHVLESGSMILLDLPAATLTSTVERLEQFLFSEDVQIGSLAEQLTGVWVHGALAAATLERVLDAPGGLAVWTSYQHTSLDFGGEPVSVARIDQLGVPGYCIYVDRRREAHLVAALQAAGAVVAGAAALEAARIEAGYPLFGVDMTETTIPLEAGIEARAISLTKGCYVGQEIIIRVLHRGGGRVAKKLVGLRIDRPADRLRQGDGESADASAKAEAGHDVRSIERGAKLLSGDREIGEITSAAESLRAGTVALGYVHRDFTAAGTAIHVAAGADRRSATVTERPMPVGSR